MSKEFILMLHPTFGVLALIAAVWVFVDTLNATDTKLWPYSKHECVSRSFNVADLYRRWLLVRRFLWR